MFLHALVGKIPVKDIQYNQHGITPSWIFFFLCRYEITSITLENVCKVTVQQYPVSYKLTLLLDRRCRVPRTVLLVRDICLRRCDHLMLFSSRANTFWRKGDRLLSFHSVLLLFCFEPLALEAQMEVTRGLPGHTQLVTVLG